MATEFDKTFDKAFEDIGKVVEQLEKLNKAREQGIWENRGDFMVTSSVKKLEGNELIPSHQIIVQIPAGSTRLKEQTKADLDFIANAPTTAEALRLCFGLLKFYKGYVKKMEQIVGETEIEVTPEEMQEIF